MAGATRISCGGGEKRIESGTNFDSIHRNRLFVERLTKFTLIRRISSRQISYLSHNQPVRRGHRRHRKRLRKAHRARTKPDRSKAGDSGRRPAETRDRQRDARNAQARWAQRHCICDRSTIRNAGWNASRKAGRTDGSGNCDGRRKGPDFFRSITDENCRKSLLG